MGAAERALQIREKLKKRKQRLDDPGYYGDLDAYSKYLARPEAPQFTLEPDIAVPFERRYPPYKKQPIVPTKVLKGEGTGALPEDMPDPDRGRIDVDPSEKVDFSKMISALSAKEPSADITPDVTKVAPDPYKPTAEIDQNVSDPWWAKALIAFGPALIGGAVSGKQAGAKGAVLGKKGAESYFGELREDKKAAQAAKAKTAASKLGFERQRILKGMEVAGKEQLAESEFERKKEFEGIKQEGITEIKKLEDKQLRGLIDKKFGLGERAKESEFERKKEFKGIEGVQEKDIAGFKHGLGEESKTTAFGRKKEFEDIKNQQRINEINLKFKQGGLTKAQEFKYQKELEGLKAGQRMGLETHRAALGEIGKRQDFKRQKELEGIKAKQRTHDRKKAFEYKKEFENIKKMAEKGKPNFINESKLRQEFMRNKIVADTIQISKSYGVFKKSYEMGKKQKSGNADLSMLYAIIRIFDPASVVKGDEVRLMREATAPVSNILRHIKRWTLDKDTMLTDEQREDFKQIAEDIYSNQTTIYRALENKYKSLATDYGFDPERISVPILQPEQAPAEPVNLDELRGMADKVNLESKLKTLNLEQLKQLSKGIKGE